MSAVLSQTGRGLGALGGVSSYGANQTNSGALGTLGTAASSAGEGLGLVGGLEQGGVGGYGSAALNAGKLAGNTGAFGSSTSAANTGIGDAASALAIYQGLQQGGVGGYGGAAVNAAKLGAQAGAFGGASGAVGTVAGYAAIPLALYNEINNWQSGSTGSDAASGAETGASVGSVFGPIGTGVGALVGGAAGALSSLAGPGKTDPETADSKNLINAVGANPNEAQAITGSVNDPYLELAGLMDERSSTLPMYQQYGRMGEQKFTDALTGQINDAFTSGITSGADKGDTWSIDPTSGDYVLKNPNGTEQAYGADQGAAQVYDSVVNPWVSGMGKGYQNVGSTYADTTQGLLQDMTGQYLSGDAGTDWKSVGGQDPFSNIYEGSPFSAAAAPATSATPPSTPTSAATNLATLRGQLAAKGGSMKTDSKKTLAGIRKRHGGKIRHFDDGGSSGDTDFISSADSNDYGDYTPTFNPEPTLENISAPDLNMVAAGGDSAVNGVNDPYAYSSGTTKSGLASLASSIAPYAALAPVAASVIGKLAGSGSSSSGSLPAGQSSGPTTPYEAQTFQRSLNPVNPDTDWYTYGSHPETNFFSNNSIGPLMGSFAGQSPSASGAPPTMAPANAPGGQSMINVPIPSGSATMQPVPTRAPISLKAAGGALDSVDDDDSLDTAAMPPSPHYVRGAGDGTSDDINAKLSDGEYVMDAGTVSMLGNGSNEAGAKRLDQLRMNLRKHAGKSLVKGKQFMKAKPPEAYLRGGSKKQ